MLLLRLEARDIALVGLFAALTAVGAFLRIPIPYMPITLQVFFVLLAGVLLGARLGALSQFIYLIMGLSGLPIFAEGGGPGYIFHPTFGFIIGFIPAAWIMGILTDASKYRVNKTRVLFSSAAALTVIYLAGIPYLYYAINFFLDQEMAFINAAKIGLVFLPGDALKIAFLSAVGPSVVRNIRGMNR